MKQKNTAHTQWMVSVALMAAIVILLANSTAWNDPASNY